MEQPRGTPCRHAHHERVAQGGQRGQEGSRVKLEDLDAEPELPARRLVLTPASPIEPEPVIWAWEDAGYGRVHRPFRRSGGHRPVLSPDPADPPKHHARPPRRVARPAPRGP